MNTDTYELPELPEPETWSESYPDGVSEQTFSADQMREYALLAVKAERERIARLVTGQTHPVAEYLYGHTREMAAEWAKADKYDSDADKADDILAIVVAAIRKAP